MDVERRENDWLVTMTWEERAEIATDSEHPPDRAVAAVADLAGVNVDELNSAVVRTSGEDGVAIVVRPCM